MFAIQYNGIASATTQDFDNLIITLWGDVKDGDILKGTIYLGVKDGDVVKLYACNVTVYVSNDPASVNGITLNKKVSGNVYDLSGRLIQRNANDTKSLSKGIYLMNGKKFIVK
jgi:basic membrane lipoprotein Med (substrate-binding protein (PBP1-ABC) superfamily)